MEWSISVTRLAVTLAPLAVATLYIIQRLLQNRIERKGYPLPPGPTGLPILGCVLSISAQPWLTLGKWRAKHGE